MNTQFNTISEDSKLLLVEMRLSRQTDTVRVEDPNGLLGPDGKRYLNLTSDNRKMYIAVFRDPTDPFGAERTRVFSQNTDSSGANAVWKKGNPALIQKFVGKVVPAEIITRDVVPYTVGENTGITTFTCVVLKNENINSVFASQTHPIIGSPQDNGMSLATAMDNASKVLTVVDTTVDTETGEILEETGEEGDSTEETEEEEAVDVSELIGEEEKS
jgi:hypothetical protein